MAATDEMGQHSTRMPLLPLVETSAAVFGVVTMAAVPMSPGQDLAVLAEGRLIASGGLAWWPVFLATVAAVIVTDVTMFSFGQHALTRVLPGGRYPRTAALVQRLALGGDLGIVAARFVPGTRLLLFPAAATRGITLRRFLMLDACATLVWVAAMLRVGSWLVRL